MSPKEYEYNEKIHATIINPYLSKYDFDANCELIRKFNIRNISTTLLFLKDLKEYFYNFKVNLKTYISYPLSDLPNDHVNDLIRHAEDLGANEIEYSPKFFLLSKNDDNNFALDIENISSSDLPVTLIFNKQRLKEKYFKRAIEISLELGIDNFQFGDGFAAKPSSRDIKEILKLINRNHLLKIVGGINNLDQVNQLLDAGVNCVGSSNFYDIFKEINSN